MDNTFDEKTLESTNEDTATVEAAAAEPKKKKRRSRATLKTVEETAAASDAAATTGEMLAEKAIDADEQASSQELEDAETAGQTTAAFDEAPEVVVGDDTQPEDKPFDEAELLELAKNEGLVDASIDETQESSTEADEPIDLPEEQQAFLTAALETVLFMSDKPASLPKLRATIDNTVPLKVYRKLMARLRADFARENRGIEIAELALGFQLRTKPHMASVLRKMVKTQPLRLSAATMEVLAVVAYKQPVTKDEIDQIRGVDSGYVLRNLMEKRLVKIAGRSDLPGKPMVYATTHEFLELFNLKDTNQLPPLHEVEAMVAASEVGFEEKTKAVMEEFGKMVANQSTILFDDSKIDDELESLRQEIANIPTSTPFIDAQKAKEKLKTRLDALAAKGMTLNAEGAEIPVETEGALTADEIIAQHEMKWMAEQEAAEAERRSAEAALAAAERAVERAAAAADEASAGDVAPATEESVDVDLSELTPLEAPTTVTTQTITADSDLAIQVSLPIEAGELIETISEDPAPAFHEPSPELTEAAEAAQWERHSAMIAQAIGEAQATASDVAVVNAEAMADAVIEAKIEQELYAESLEEEAESGREPEAEI